MNQRLPMRYLIQLSYSGLAYHGWQKQENAHSVQSELEIKLSLLCGKNIETLGCGRTDTGVHASMFFAHFDIETPIDTERTVYKLNQMLPEDIAIQKIMSVPDLFNARFDATERTYQYHITRIKDPFLKDIAWYQYGLLDIEKMNEAAAFLLTHSDFTCFSKVKTQVNNFICDITYANWEANQNHLVFTIKANRFLRNMVRAIVGTLLEVGKNRLTLQAFKQVLESKNRSEAGQSVPAYGLFLTDIQYPEEKLRLQ